MDVTELADTVYKFKEDLSRLSHTMQQRTSQKLKENIQKQAMKQRNMDSGNMRFVKHYSFVTLRGLFKEYLWCFCCATDFFTRDVFMRYQQNAPPLKNTIAYNFFVDN